MAQQCPLRLAAALLAASALLARADWWDSVGGVVDSAVSEVAQASEAVAEKTDVKGLLEKGANLTGSALEQAEDAACDFKVWEDVQDVNRTMTSQLSKDCETTASSAAYMHDRLYKACKSMGLWNINRTLEQQKSTLKSDCMDMLHKAPGDMKAALAEWSNKSKAVLTEKVGPSVHSAIVKAQKTIQGGSEVEAKFTDFGPLALRASVPVPPLVLLAIPFLVVAAGAFAWRRLAGTTPLVAHGDGLHALTAPDEEDASLV